MVSRRHTLVPLMLISLKLVAGQVPSSVDDLSATCSAGGECAGAEAKSSSLLQKTKLAVQFPLGVDEAEQGRPKVSWTSMEQNVAEQRDTARVRLGIEGDLRKFQSSMRAWKEDEDCETNARKAYDEAVQAAGLAAELTEEEQANFASRFVEEMLADCKYDPDIKANWVKDVSEALEHQKPIVTEAFAASVNKADLGFKVEVRDWMKNESKTDFDNLLGMDAELSDPKNISAASLLELKSMQIPETFDSATKVPACAETIQRIHNQGTCGSCWAFGTLQAMDGRLCISTNGGFSGPKAALSRGYTTSCSTPGGRNGCNGGWFSFVYNIMGEGISCDRGGGGCKGSPGIPTGLDNGCIPYFGHGSGVDHFNSKSSAPPCSTGCVKTYSYRPLKQDLYIAPGGGGWASNAEEFGGARDTAAAQKARKAIYEHGPLPYAVNADSAFKGYSSGVLRGQCQTRPNHCVTAIGYGKDYFDSQNSWGTRWGDKGGFKLADCLVTHWSIPPPMPTAGIPSIPGSNGPPAPGPPAPGPPAPGPDGAPGPSPPPAPPMKPVWSVSSGECSVDGSGCMRSPNFRPGGEGDKDECEGKSSKYLPNQTCTFDLVSSTSPAIEVVDFVTEKGFDIFTVNGVAFSGGGGDVKNLHGMVPTGQMTFVSDKGFEKTGFKLCPRDPREDMVYVGPYDDGATTHQFYVGEGAASPWPDFTEAGKFKSKKGSDYTIYVSSGEPPRPPSPGPAPPGPSPGPSPGPAPPSPGPPPPAPQPSGPDPEASAWLQIHNYFRCIHNTQPIEWDKDVAEGSAEWAQRGQMSHSKSYKIPAPRGPSGENLAAGQKDIEAAVTAWYDESPERGPSCGGHCTALLWKKSKGLGCSKKNTWNGNRPMYVCRYAKSAANYNKNANSVNMPDYSREEQCYGQFPVGTRWKGGGGRGSGTLEGSNDTDLSDGKGEAVTDDEPAHEEDPSNPEPAEKEPADAAPVDAATTEAP